MQRLLDSVFPPMCVFCGLHKCETVICECCQRILPRNDNYCCHCGQPVDAPGDQFAPCGACIANPPAFDIARAPMRYEFPIDVVLKKLKYNHKLFFVPPLAGLLTPVIERELPESDVLVPVPLHRWRHARRGFNQADELCKILAKATGLPVFLSVSRRRSTRSQSGLDAAERASNVRNAFVMYDEFDFRFPLIVDDVITTGATCNELAKVLRKAGAERVGALSVARSSGL